eukprot:Skav228561  [mRNA]  locus=scaffold4568:30056:32814:+ [translate_table: standard]
MWNAHGRRPWLPRLQVCVTRGDELVSENLRLRTESAEVEEAEARSWQWHPTKVTTRPEPSEPSDPFHFSSPAPLRSLRGTRAHDLQERPVARSDQRQEPSDIKNPAVRLLGMVDDPWMVVGKGVEALDWDTSEAASWLRVEAPGAGHGQEIPSDEEPRILQQAGVPKRKAKEVMQLDMDPEFHPLCES